VERIKDFIWWYKKLTAEGYGYIMCIEFAAYNSKHHNRDGSYKINHKTYQ